MIQKGYIFTPEGVKKRQDFECSFCDFLCSKKSDYERHLLTAKHHKMSKMIQKDTLGYIFTPKNAVLRQCICGKEYKHHSGLWRHRKICYEFQKINNVSNEESNKSTLKINENEHNDMKEILKYLISENHELKEIVKEVLQNGTHNNNNNIMNSHNKTFNLQLFLNETCKNAMNISDFMNSIQLQLSDLEDVGELGYVNGISNIIIKNLKELDITQRPIHCTDAKREILYVKDQDKWEKESDQKDKMIRFVKNIANKNIKMLNEFKNKHPDCIRCESKMSDHYNKLVMEAMGGTGNDYDEKHEKIIKKITKEVTIDKEIL